MRLRIVLHVFEGGAGTSPMTRRDEEWECEVDKDDINPLLLRKDAPGGGYIYLLSQERQEGDMAIFHPLATSPKLPLLEDLPKFGWKKVSG